MEKFDELLAKLKKLNIIQKYGTWEEALPEDIYNEYFRNNCSEIKCGLDVETHRWYETSMVVVKIFDRFLGIRYASNVFSEMQDWESCYVTIEFHEMEEIKVISYKIKEQ